MSQETETEETEHDHLSAFFGDEPEETPEPQTSDEPEPDQSEDDAEAEEKPADGPPRDEKGKFAKKDAAKGETAQGKTEPKPDKSGEMVPHSVVAQLREEIRQLKARNEPGQQAQPNQPGQAEQPKIPDPIDDPQGYTAYLENQVQRRILNERLNLSETMARQSVGDEAVDAALEAYQSAAASNPSLAYQFAQSRNPYGDLLSWHRKQQALSEVGEDPEAYRERIRQELMAELQGQQNAPVQAKPKATPPPSLAKGGTNSAPSNIEGDQDWFGSVFRG